MLKIDKITDFYLEQIIQIENQSHITPWSKDVLQSCFNDRYFVYGLIVDNELLGYAIYSFVLDEAELQNIAILPSAQGKGLGKQLLTHSLKQLHQHEIKKVFLEVRVSNKIAINLYKSVGFNDDFIRRNYYHINKFETEDALCMSLELLNFSIC
jgi:ribosomal-protein-alanine N-acetyltransferase